MTKRRPMNFKQSGHVLSGVAQILFHDSYRLKFIGTFNVGSFPQLREDSRVSNRPNLRQHWDADRSCGR